VLREGIKSSRNLAESVSETVKKTFEKPHESNQVASKIKVENSLDQLDNYDARQVGTEVSNNPVSSRAYSQIQKSGKDVLLDHGSVTDELGITPLNKWGTLKFI
jgi:hypothetical protein